FTMGGAVAALATRRYFKFDKVIPCHYASFLIIDQTADKFVSGMEGGTSEVVVAKANESFSV
ncbi:MAG: metal-dependent hydrolase, partial [Alphaproteobacteria bacterium]